MKGVIYLPDAYESQYVLCPFYKTHKELKEKQNKYIISCEGLVDYSNISLNYKFLKDRELQFKIFCCDKYSNCEIYRLLMNEKYS